MNAPAQLLRHCNFQDKAIREYASVTLLTVMKIAFERSKEFGLRRLKLQFTIAMSRLVGADIQVPVAIVVIVIVIVL